MRKFFWIPEIAYDLRKEGKIFIDKGKFFFAFYIETKNFMVC